MARILKRQFSTHSLPFIDYSSLGFHFSSSNLSRKDRQRLGILHTPHGDILTPSFIFCATKGAMKGITQDIMKQEHTQIILSNTYHLLLQPGSNIIYQLGGLQKFLGWNKPMLTDSGGYQIFSMGHGSVR
jgi:queuine tRNA-ribosyltransferase